MAFKLITDSCCDLPLSYYAQNNVIMMPLSFIIDGNVYKDTDESQMTPHQFYDKLRAGSISSTSQINTLEFEEVFEPILAGGDDLIYLAFSGKLSGTCKNAEAAAENCLLKYPGRKARVIDTKSASMGQGLLLHHVLRQMKKGLDMDEVVAWAEENRGTVCHWFTVDDLAFLRRGGRLSGAAAFFGTMLSIKPVLHVDDEGRLIPMEKVQGRKRSLKALLDHMEQTAVDIKGQTIFISHGDCLGEAEELADGARRRFGVKDILINPIGAVIGSHTGANVMALFFIGNKR